MNVPLIALFLTAWNDQSGTCTNLRLVLSAHPQFHKWHDNVQVSEDIEKQLFCIYFNNILQVHHTSDVLLQCFTHAGDEEGHSTSTLLLLSLWTLSKTVLIAGFID